MKITVAIPCYNLEDRIARCLESVISQDYHDVEILIIDDGSTDGSVGIIENLIRNNPERDIRLIINKKNIGLNKVRNLSIREARGEYLYFIDGDDTIEPGALSLFSRTMEEKNVDVVCGSFRTIDVDGSTILVEKHFIEDTFRGDFAYASYIEKYVKGYFHVAVWNNLYNIDFLRSHNIYCATHYVNYEDCLFTFKVVLCAQSISFLNNITYNYCKHPRSISSEIVDSFWLKNICAVIDSIFEAYNVFSTSQKDLSQIPYGIRFVINYVCLTCGLLKKGMESQVDKKEKIGFLVWLQKQFKNNNMSFREIAGVYNKLSYLILISPFPYPLFRFYFKHLKTISKLINTFSK